VIRDTHMPYKGYPDTFLELTKVIQKIEIVIETHHRLQAYKS
jgi:hypothetical protein